MHPQEKKLRDKYLRAKQIAKKLRSRGINQADTYFRYDRPLSSKYPKFRDRTARKSTSTDTHIFFLNDKKQVKGIRRLIKCKKIN